MSIFEDFWDWLGGDDGGMDPDEADILEDVGNPLSEEEAEAAREDILEHYDPDLGDYNGPFGPDESDADDIRNYW